MESIKASGKVTGKNLPQQQSDLFKAILTITCRQEVQLEAGQRSNGEPVELDNLAEDTLLELEFEGGYKRWVRAGDLRAQTVQEKNRVGNQSWVITPSSFDTARNRGAVGLVLRFLRVLDIELVGDLTNAAVNKIVEMLEVQRMAQTRLFRCADTSALKLQAFNATELDVSQPVLLFLHGTFSSTDGSFGELWEARAGYNPAAWLQRLFAPYRGQILTLEHYTLTVSPIHNALQVVRELPANTRLHLISHSRGGLIGELLCQAGLQRGNGEDDKSYHDDDTIFTSDELRAFNDPVRQSERDDLNTLATLLREKNIRVERFLRVACPMRGTVLAAARLEDNLSVLFNLLNLQSLPRFRLLAEFVRMVLLAVVKKRTNPRELPGIEAMMPTSPLIRLLNRPNVCLPASDLIVIAGNTKASTVLGHFKAWVNEGFFGEENDYAVNTVSMYGGLARQKPLHFYVDQRDSSSHFGYFRDAQVLDCLLNGLQKPEKAPLLQTLPAGVNKPSLARAAVEDASKKNALYFIPAGMGSTLSVNDSPVWLDMGALSWGDFSLLKMAQAGVQAGEILATAYQPLLNYLADFYRVETFPYDWRRCLLEAGRDLGKKLEQELEQAAQAKRKLVVRLLAHSSGGLVLNAMMSELPGVWKRLQEEADCRCVLLGTPLQGTFNAAQILLGKHRLVRMLDLVDGQAREEDKALIAEQSAEWLGLLQQLPLDWLQEGRWQAPLGNRFATWSARRLLPDAQRVRAQLQAVSLDTQRVLYVHGQARLTPCDLRMDSASNAWRFRANGEGDGVTLRAGLNFRGQQWFMPVEHGYMASHADYFPAILNLLTEGSTQQLDQIPPQTAAVGEQWLPEIQAELYPDETELRAAALGFHTQITREEVRPQVDVRVIHGDLEYSSYPVVVGHYEGDAILSSESVLDRCLDGRLSELQRLGKYPGALKTSEVVFNPGKKPGGAVVVGLGEVGKLTPSRLLATFMDAMINYALAVRTELARPAAMPVPDEVDFVPVRVATLLVGTIAGGVSLADAIASILRAVVRANLLLDKTEHGAKVRLSTVDFIEIYEDRAVEAARVLRNMVTYPEFRQDFSARSLLALLPGNRRRVMYRDSSGWWRRLQIEAHQDGLKYTSLTDRARAELVLQSTQRRLVDQFIEKATASSNGDTELGKILFELLLPPEMKEQAPNAENLVLVLDAEASAYPWELLYDRRNPESQPLSVRSGVLRQLMVTQYSAVKRSTFGRTALVIGDPPTEMPFPRLDAAHQEAEMVVKLLEEGGFTEVVGEIGSSSQAILHALLTGDYRVLHLAGHGVYRYQPNEDSDTLVSGMVLGNGIFLTPVEIRQMGSIPEFVFINCCYLGKMDKLDEAAKNTLTADRSKLAASFAEELIAMGVKAVVAAGWAINDEAARVFSETCYRQLLQGYTFGKAVLEARRETWRLHSGANTWGAYQCYGDPEYRLVNRKPEEEQETSTQTSESWRFVAEVEVVTELRNLINASDTSQVLEYPELSTRLQQLHAAIPAQWLGQASILYHLGRAYGKLELYPQALEAYRAAIDSPESDYPLSMLEDKVNLQTAWALGIHLGQMSAPDGVDPAVFTHLLMDDSLKIIKLLEGLGNSLQRMEDEGKYWKRQAMITTGEERTRALQMMETAYKKAHEFVFAATAEVAVYPLINWLTGRVVRYLRGQLKQLDRQEIKQWMQKALQAAESAEKAAPSFLTGITLAEYSLLDYLLSARLQEDVQMQGVIHYYDVAVSRGTAPRKIRYVSEHLTFLQCMLEAVETGKETSSQSVLTTLQDIRLKLASKGSMVV